VGGRVAAAPEPSWSHRPLQSVIRQRSSRRAGLPAPGTDLVLAEHPTLPVFPSLSTPKEATPWAILSWGSVLLHGISRCPRPRPLDRRHLSWGFVPLQRTRRKESTSRPVARPSSPVARDPPTAPTLPTTVPLAGFLNLSAALSSLRRPAIFRQVALLGFCPPGVRSSRADPMARRHRRAFLTFLLPVALPSVLGEGTSRHSNRYLGSTGRCLFSSSRLSSARESIRITGPRLMS